MDASCCPTEGGVDATPATRLRSEPRGWVTGCALKATSLATSRPRDAETLGLEAPATPAELPHAYGNAVRRHPPQTHARAL
eukprot:scaffold10469_cov118-Isochrysis_galbana.AAC.6